MNFYEVNLLTNVDNIWSFQELLSLISSANGYASTELKFVSMWPYKECVQIIVWRAEQFSALKKIRSRKEHFIHIMFISHFSTCFLMGPLNQLKKMFAKTRIIATILVLVSALYKITVICKKITVIYWFICIRIMKYKLRILQKSFKIPACHTIVIIDISAIFSLFLCVLAVILHSMTFT